MHSPVIEHFPVIPKLLTDCLSEIFSQKVLFRDVTGLDCLSADVGKDLCQFSNGMGVNLCIEVFAYYQSLRNN